MNVRETKVFKDICEYITDEDEQDVVADELNDIVATYTDDCGYNLEASSVWNAFVFSETKDECFWFNIAALEDKHRR